MQPQLVSSRRDLLFWLSILFLAMIMMVLIEGHGTGFITSDVCLFAVRANHAFHTVLNLEQNAAHNCIPTGTLKFQEFVISAGRVTKNMI